MVITKRLPCTHIHISHTPHLSMSVVIKEGVVIVVIVAGPTVYRGKCVSIPICAIKRTRCTHTRSFSLAEYECLRWRVCARVRVRDLYKLQSDSEKQSAVKERAIYEEGEKEED